MARRRHTSEQVIRKLREAERLLGEGQSISEVAKHLEVAEGTYHRWQRQFGGMRADDARRLKGAGEREQRPQTDRGRSGGGDRRPPGDRPGKLVSPSSRRRAVHMLMDRLEVSERRACLIAGQHRSTQRHRATRALDSDALRARLREFSVRRPRWGYRRAWVVLNEEGWAVNHKQVQRLWREEGLRVPQRAKSASGWGPPRCQPTGFEPPIPIMCGRWTSSSTSLPMGGPSNC